SLEMIDLPTPEMRAADIPFPTLAVRRQYEGPLPRPHQNSHAAHLSLQLPVCRTSNRHAAARRGQASTLISKPPKTMRLTSNGISDSFIIPVSRSSFMTFALTWSRCARDL